MAFRVALTFFFIATPAYAYIDPNAQGHLLQALTPIFVIGTGVALFFAIGSYRDPAGKRLLQPADRWRHGVTRLARL